MKHLLDIVINFLSILLDKKLHNRYIMSIEIYKPYRRKTRTPMHTSQDERGILNNFAVEPTLYFAETPSPAQQRQYWIQGAVATTLIAILFGVALIVS
jgi:hypothetical protein